MGPIAVIAAVAAVVWGAVFVRRMSLIAGCLTFVVLGYVFPHAFWHRDIGLTTLTVDRLCILGLGVILVAHWRSSKVAVRRMSAADWLLIALVVYLTVRCALTPPAGEHRSSVGPWWRIITGFWMPAVLYAAIRLAPLGERAWRQLLIGFAALGGYLAVTGLAEASQQWWAVFPHFIADPELGTHFGRARGPALMSASMGVYLSVCFWAAWFLWPRVALPGKVILSALLPAAAAGVYLTYTRSTWLGLAGGLAVIPLLQMPKRWRPVAAVACVVVGTIGVAAFGQHITHLGRKDSDASAAHSVYQRASFLYVSMRMFRDAPVFGHGVSRFYDAKLPYLADRTQQLELESLRNLEHHNTLLSILVETGLVGLLLYGGLMACWAVASWRVFRAAPAGSWTSAQGLFGLAVWIAFLATALFHDLTLSATEHWLLFLSAGLSVALLTNQPAAVGASASLGDVVRTAVGRWSCPAVRGQHFQPPPAAATPGRVTVLGMTIDAVDMSTAVRRVLSWCAAPTGGPCKYVVTPNVDHAVMYDANENIRKAYRSASLVLADGAPIVLASRLLGKGLPERVAGSDLVPALFERASQSRRSGQPPARRLRVFLLGAAPGVAERAESNIAARWPGVEVVGTYSPPLGFEHDEAESQRILYAVASAQPDLLIVGLGAPKQELWVSRHARQLKAKAALCVGATIDFLAGERHRAPSWMRACGLEWLHRLLSEPRRLAQRYLRDARIFPLLVWRDWRHRPQGGVRPVFRDFG